jgi:hypothetical protein
VSGNEAQTTRALYDFINDYPVCQLYPSPRAFDRAEMERPKSDQLTVDNPKRSSGKRPSLKNHLRGIAVMRI